MDDVMSVWAKFEGYDEPEDELGPGETVVCLEAEGQSVKTAAKQLTEELWDRCEDLPEWLDQDEVASAIRTALYDGDADLSKDAGCLWVRVRWDHEIE